MRRAIVLCTVGFLMLAACNNPKKPSEGNFKLAINQYFETHGKMCVSFSHPFPMDVPQSELNDQYGTVPQLAALEQAKLLQSLNTTAVVHGLLDPLRGTSKPQPVKRYEISDQGKKYFQQYSGLLGQTEGFCYAQKSVHSIVKWDEPMTMNGFSATSVTYTYQLDNLADWAKQPEVERAFPQVKVTLDQAETTNQVAGLHLTNQGWEVNGQ